MQADSYSREQNRHPRHLFLSIYIFIHELPGVVDIPQPHLPFCSSCAISAGSRVELPAPQTAGGKVSHHLAGRGRVCRRHTLDGVSTRIYTAAAENVSTQGA